jgi:hypothetical protein
MHVATCKNQKPKKYQTNSNNNTKTVHYQIQIALRFDNSVLYSIKSLCSGLQRWHPNKIPGRGRRRSRARARWNNPSKQARVPYQQQNKPVEARISRVGERKRRKMTLQQGQTHLAVTLSGVWLEGVAEPS